VRHTPAGSEATYEFAAVRWRAAGEMFWRYAFVVCEGGRAAAAVLARHRLKGEKELLFKEVLRGLDLHHPPCAELQANAMFYAIAALAYDLMVAVKVLVPARRMPGLAGAHVDGAAGAAAGDAGDACAAAGGTGGSAGELAGLVVGVGGALVAGGAGGAGGVAGPPEERC
jgi:hypothetical protein